MEPQLCRDKLGGCLDTPEHGHVPDLKAILVQLLSALLGGSRLDGVVGNNILSRRELENGGPKGVDGTCLFRKVLGIRLEFFSLLHTKKMLRSSR